MIKYKENSLSSVERGKTILMSLKLCRRDILNDACNIKYGRGTRLYNYFVETA